MKIFYALLFFILYCTPSGAQHPVAYNLGIENGMPSNHVYSGTVDKHGYLWLATSNGVVRYNGYEVKVFNTASGLPKNDVWGLYCDKKNRIWLQTIGAEIGYIYNDTYHSAHATKSNILFYPAQITEDDSGILFISKAMKKRKGGDIELHLLSIERNDTVYFQFVRPLHAKVYDKDNIVSYSNDLHMNNRFDGNKLVPKSKTRHYILPYATPGFRYDVFFQHYGIMYYEGADRLLAYDVNNDTMHEIILETVKDKTESIHGCYWHRDTLYITGQQGIYLFDKSLHQVRVAPYHALGNALLPLSYKNVSWYLHMQLWGENTFTTTDGIFMQLPSHNLVKPVPADGLENYKWLGYGHSSFYLWDDNKKNMLSIDEHGHSKTQYMPYLQFPEKIVPLLNGSSVISTRNDLCFFDEGNHYAPVQIFRNIYLGRVSINTITPKDEHHILVNYSNRTDEVTLTDTGFNVKHVTTGSMQHVVADKFRKGVWLYTPAQVNFIKENTSVTVNKAVLQWAGIHYIEQLCIDDSYGNIFVYNGKHVLYIDPERRKVQQLFMGYNLQNCKLYQASGKIVCVGKSGILVSFILGRGKFSTPQIFLNPKGTLYNSVQHTAILNNTIFIKTDKGLFSAMASNNTGQLQQPPFTVLLKYNGHVSKLPAVKPIVISQDNMHLVFDVINPSGSGKVTYQYTIPGSHHAGTYTTNNELSLRGVLKPGNNYILLRVRDDIWRSGYIKVPVYITPYWWQTSIWQGIFWIAGTVLLIVFTIIISLITRRNVLKKNAKKHELMELELKAIYAQINPHFIFNSMNTTLYFLKKMQVEQAFTHVSNFSRLLRGYLDSSKNRVISIEREADNLKYYIELEQTRFENAFEYKISINGITDPANTYIPSLILQPIVENAINHGLVPKEGDGQLYISFAQGDEEGNIKCTIDDNGIGRAKSAEINSKKLFRKQSQGNELVTKLVGIFNKYGDTDISIEYIDKTEGTKVIITFRNISHEL